MPKTYKSTLQCYKSTQQTYKSMLQTHKLLAFRPKQKKIDFLNCPQ